MWAYQNPRPLDCDGQLVGRVLQLAIARDLERIYADVLHDPVPPDLRRLIEGLEHQTTDRMGDRRAAPGQRSSIGAA